MSARLPFVSDSLIDYGHVKIDLCVPPDLYERESTPGRFILGKSRGMRVIAPQPLMPMTG